jgi:hypothetical protein
VGSGSGRRHFPSLTPCTRIGEYFTWARTAGLGAAELTGRSRRSSVESFTDRVFQLERTSLLEVLKPRTHGAWAYLACTKPKRRRSVDSPAETRARNRSRYGALPEQGGVGGRRASQRRCLGIAAAAVELPPFTKAFCVRWFQQPLLPCVRCPQWAYRPHWGLSSK